MEETKFDIMPYKDGLWCVGKLTIPKIDVTTKDSAKQQFVDVKPEAKIVFRGSFKECEDWKAINTK